MYSTVNSATTLVSTPNQILVEIECTAGTVSSTVTKADKTISDVVNICMIKAAVEDVGCSNSWYNLRFHGGRISDASSCSSYECDPGNTSSTSSWGDEFVGSSVKKRTELRGGGRTRVSSMVAGEDIGRVQAQSPQCQHSRPRQRPSILPTLYPWMGNNGIKNLNVQLGRGGERDIGLSCRKFRRRTPDIRSVIFRH